MILSIDQGTTGTTAFVFDTRGRLLGRAYAELPQHYPRPGWVEHDASEIWNLVLRVCTEALECAGADATGVSAIGITNQRETTVLWDRQSGRAVCPAIVWQCRRSAEICTELQRAGKSDYLRQKTGLLLDAYFSASKLQWIFRAQPELLARAEAGELCFGTIDSWLIWKLSGGRAHVTDHTNASRTLLYDIEARGWDTDLLALFGCPDAILPEIRPSAGLFGHTAAEVFFRAEIPICGVAGDQQAALFGQGCTSPGSIKNTYGTGCFMLAYGGAERPRAPRGLLTTIACDPAGAPAYALEGAVFNAGSAVQWLRDGLGLIQQAADTEAIAEGVADTKGVYLVPAFSGLGAPHWDPSARGMICGLSRGSGRAELVRATLESIAYQSDELAQLMADALGVKISCLRVDGGASANNFLMQFQADISRVRVARPQQIETTAVGAALLAGIGAGIWPAGALPQGPLEIERDFEPGMSSAQRDELMGGWRRAVAACRNF
ncbi:glycerol kinase GlpK [Microbulbifer sp. TYP-18]|uniref:glycerol kinase GlpK n=1 Tax=Microbulbifer sp. TYP-18 TaxID=3230024 RepID=UPI0034C61ADD